MSEIKLRGLEHFTSDEFHDFCCVNDNYRIERDHEGAFLVCEPAWVYSSYLNAELVFQLELWNRKNKTGFVFESSGGFTLSDTSILAPDASWVSYENFESHTAEEQAGYAKIAPEFIAEIRSNSDPINKLLEKMDKWMKNGVKLAWMIDPYQKIARVYRQGSEIIETVSFDTILKGEDILRGFELDLNPFKKKLEKTEDD